MYSLLIRLSVVVFFFFSAWAVCQMTIFLNFVLPFLTLKINGCNFAKPDFKSLSQPDIWLSNAKVIQHILGCR